MIFGDLYNIIKIIEGTLLSQKCSSVKVLTDENYNLNTVSESLRYIPAEYMAE